MIGKLIYWLFCIIRPILGPAACRYPISCMEYARIVLEDCPLFTAMRLIAKRVFLCNGLWNIFNKQNKRNSL